MLDNEPPGARGNVEMVEARLAEVAADPTRETVTIEWRGRPRSIDVIDMPVAALYYNPDTHRIRAQRALDAERERELLDSPWSDASQEYLHELLRGDPSDPVREDPEFAALRQDLKEHGQNDPGIITPSGILVNGNTRRAALRELGQPNIRVGVLPKTWSHADVRDVELALQLRKEYRRDYSFINFLLAVDEQVQLGRTPQDVIRDFRIKQTTFNRARWILAFIRDAISRSKIVGADGRESALRYVDFERDQGKLEELYRAVVNLESKDPDAAHVVRETRLAALVLGFSKTDLRLVDPDFQSKYLGDEGGAEELGGAAIAIPGLSVTVPDASATVKRASAATTRILQTRATVIANDPEQAEHAAAALHELKQTFDRGLDAAGRTERLRRRQLAAPERMNDAADTIAAAVEELIASRAAGALDEEAFDESLVALREAMTKLAVHAGRSIRDPGPGLSWLNHATAHSNGL